MTGMTDGLSRDPAQKIVITAGPPPGYRETGSGPLLTCNRCGALVMEPGLHDRWHQRLSTGRDPLLHSPDVRVEVFAGDGTAVRLTHLPTGATATAVDYGAGEIETKERAALMLRKKLQIS
jgi:hypothetical protein